MNLQKRLAGDILKCSPSRIRFDESKLSEIKDAITKFDVRRAINRGSIRRIAITGNSRVRTRKALYQKRRGRRIGHGSRKGKASARLDPKFVWMNNVRSQRRLLQVFKVKKMVDNVTYRSLYAKVHGGFFRSTQHIKTYVKENDLLKHGTKQ